MTSSTTHPYNLITSIICSLSTVAPSPQDANPNHRSFYTTRGNTLTNLSQSDDRLVRNAFMTLHFLFPHEVLPALDLLDRKLVTRLLITSTVQASSSIASSSGGAEIKSDGKKEDEEAAPKVDREVFFVQSASATSTTMSSSRSSRYRKAYNPCNVHYEVRLQAWNCSCPAFAFAAFRSLSLSTKRNHGSTIDNNKDDHVPNMKVMGAKRDWHFGGTVTRPGAGAPVCKHILAAVLGREAPNLFGEGVTTRQVSREEGAGWVGGWGD